jgi:hypothetical protein
MSIAVFAVGTRKVVRYLETEEFVQERDLITEELEEFMGIPNAFTCGH